jgi:hypothetical protein
MAERLQEWQRDAARAVDDKLMRDIVNDFRTYSPTPRSEGPAETVTPVGAGRVIDGGDGAKHRSWGWQDPIPLERRDWASMSEQERAARDEEWRREYAARREAEGKAKEQS